MSKCAICGRALSNPQSVARGVGPVCGGRMYVSRIRSRYGSCIGGWSAIEEWEKVNCPCYSCKLFEFPAKGQEVKTEDGFRVIIHGLSFDFSKDAIGGYCKAYKVLVDGNLINEHTWCKGKLFIRRKSEEETPKVGLLRNRNQIELFEI